jgi:hypothetical protein
MNEFEWFSFVHIYKELNSHENDLSKEALMLDPSSFIAQEIYDGCLCDENIFFIVVPL